MRKWTAVLLALCLLMMPVLTLAENTLTVTGSATVKLEADMASTTLGVSVTGQDAARASADNAALIDTVVAALASAGVAETDIETASYSVSPSYSYDEQGNYTMNGYTVCHMLTVVIRDKSRVGTVLDAAISAGANENYGTEFRSSRSGEAYDQALTQAVAEAGRKAQLLADAAGVKLGSVTGVTEEGGSSVSVRKNLAESAAASDTGTSLYGGSAEVTATVTVTYSIN